MTWHVWLVLLAALGPSTNPAEAGSPLVAGSHSVAESGADAQSPRKADKPEILTLSGCVALDPRQNNLFTLTDAGDPTVYRLTGVSVKKYVGQRVEISGTQPKRLKIVGGLYPSPNVAAQAGAMDPAKAAVAAQTDPNPANVAAMVEIRVKSVRLVPGSCPEK